jgi:hypothetical protein
LSSCNEFLHHLVKLLDFKYIFCLLLFEVTVISALGMQVEIIVRRVSLLMTVIFHLLVSGDLLAISYFDFVMLLVVRYNILA